MACITLNFLSHILPAFLSSVIAVVIKQTKTLRVLQKKRELNRTGQRSKRDSAQLGCKGKDGKDSGLLKLEEREQR